MNPGLKNLKALRPGTAKALKNLAAHSFMESYTLVGGSALALYLDHRVSEDLDFFIPSGRLEAEKIISFLSQK